MKAYNKGHLRAGFHSVRTAKLRSFWTMLGVIIGVTSVITVVSIGEGIKAQINSQVSHFGKDLVTVRPAQLSTTLDSGNKGLNLLSGLSISAPLSSKDVATVSKTKGVASSAPLTIANGTVRAPNGVYRNGLVLGTTGDLPGLINHSLAFGAFFTEANEGQNVAVLGQGAIDEMFDEDVPLGRSFTFHGERFIVRGIFNPFSTTPLSQLADFNKAIFIPNDVAETLSKESAPTYAILARPSNKSHTVAVAASIEKALVKAHGGQDNVEVLAGSDEQASSSVILDLVTRMIAGIAAISLLVGGIGIMNVMLVSVAERTHEIGIRKAIGATNRQILSQFMVESSVLSLVGGVIGIILALLLNIILRLTTNLQPLVTWQIVLIATGVSLLVGIIFGTVPAFKAARKTPIESLRAE
jgi:putative ABC transport system permease protein